MEALGTLQGGLERLGLVLEGERDTKLLAYLHELQRWAQRINLTAIRDLEAGIEKHLLDSLTLVPMLRGDERLLDIGSGAGLPGIPLKIALPSLALVSVDAVEKKIMFQRHVLRQLGVEAETLHARIEKLAEDNRYRASFDVVTARAFTSLNDLLALARPFLKEGGRVLAMKGPEGAEEWLRQAESSGGWECREVRRLCLPFTGAERLVFDLRREAGNH